MSNNISFETGLKAFTINGDANRKIYFDPNDIGIIDRLEAAAMAIKAKADEMGTQESDTDARTTIRKLDAYAREQVDAAFPEQCGQGRTEGSHAAAAAGRTAGCCRKRKENQKHRDGIAGNR